VRRRAVGAAVDGHTAHAGDWQRQRWCLAVLVTGQHSAARELFPWTETVVRLESLTWAGRQLNITTEMLQNLGVAGQAAVCTKVRTGDW
jgi:hypothetical protein